MGSMRIGPRFGVVMDPEHEKRTGQTAQANCAETLEGEAMEARAYNGNKGKNK